MDKSRKWFLVVRTADDVHRLLVLKVPRRGVACEKARKEHASRQMTYRGDTHGRFAHGLRVKDPWVVNLQGGIYDTNKDKYRPVMDARSSGSNGCILLKWCGYDVLRDLLKM